MHRFHFLLTALIVVLTGCTSLAKAPPVDLTLPPLALENRPSAVDRLLEQLSLRDKVAQVVMPWVAGRYAPFDDSVFQRVQGWVDSLHVGGIIVSIGSPLDVAAKLNRLQRRSPLPLLVASDLEGGTAFRLVGGTPFPTNMGLAAGGSELDAYQMGRVTALEGRAVGIHMTFSPVADVNSNPANPIINTRSFGEDPARVAALVAAEVRGIQEHGMYAVAKHFPGHGDTETDSHLELPVLAADWIRLDTLELPPFRAAIRAGVTGIMSAHIALPRIDTGYTRPATVSPVILQGILRDSLEFHGLIVTDALNMGALVNGYGAGEAAVRAFEAGADLLLQPADPSVAIDALTDAVASGRVSLERLERSVRRVLELKRRMGLFRRRTVSLDSIPEVVGSAPFREIARTITAHSVVLAEDRDGVVDSLRAAPRPVTVITWGDEIGGAFSAELRDRGFPVQLFRLYPASGPASYDSAAVAAAADTYTIVLASVRASAWSGTIDLPPQMAAFTDSLAMQHPTVVVSLGSPYIISQMPDVGSYVLGWSPRAMSERAVARALAGSEPIEGRLPISIPPRYSRGTGLLRGMPRP